MVGEAYNSGAAITELTEGNHVTVGTILEHLMRYLAAGNQLRNWDDLQSLTSLSMEEKDSAFAAFDELGRAFLKPFFDKLNGAVNYDDLRILRLLYQIDGKT